MEANKIKILHEGNVEIPKDYFNQPMTPMIKASELRIGNYLNFLIKDEMGGEIQMRLPTKISLHHLRAIDNRADANDLVKAY